LGLRRVVSPSLLFHGGVELAHVGGHIRTPTKPRKLGVYNCGGAMRIWMIDNLDDLYDLDDNPNEGRSDMDEWFPEDGSND
jgi:hypothetical protein